VKAVCLTQRQTPRGRCWQQQRLLNWPLLQLQQQAATAHLWALQLQLVTVQQLPQQLASSSAAALQRLASVAVQHQHLRQQQQLLRHLLQRQAQLVCRHQRPQQEQQMLHLAQCSWRAQEVAWASQD
jgi:ribosome biogenesis protein Tsr3